MAYYSSPHAPCLHGQTAAFLKRILNVLILNRWDRSLAGSFGKAERGKVFAHFHQQICAIFFLPGRIVARTSELFQCRGPTIAGHSPRPPSVMAARA